MAVQVTMEPYGRVGADLRSEVRQLTRDLYDHQKLRIQMGNRLAGQFRRDLGQEPGTKTDEMDQEAKTILERLKAEWPRLADAVAKTSTRRWAELVAPHTARVVAETKAWIAAEEERLEEEKDTLEVKELRKRRTVLAQTRRDLGEGRIPYIRTPQQIAMMRHYIDMERSEVQLGVFIGILVEQFPIWHWLSSEGPDGQSGVKLLNPFCQVLPVYGSGHDDIGEDELDLALLLLHDLPGFLHCGCRDDPIVRHLQDMFDVLQNRRFIVGH